MPSSPKTTSRATLLLTWLIVATPLAWGLYQSINKSKPLFTLNQAGHPPVSPAK